MIKWHLEKNTHSKHQLKTPRRQNMYVFKILIKKSSPFTGKPCSKPVCMYSFIDTFGKTVMYLLQLKTVYLKREHPWLDLASVPSNLTVHTTFWSMLAWCFNYRYYMNKAWTTQSSSMTHYYSTETMPHLTGFYYHRHSSHLTFFKF